MSLLGVVMRKRLFRQWNDFKRYNNPWPSGFTGWYSCIDGNNRFNPCPRNDLDSQSAIDCILNHLTVVVNGKKLEDKSFPIPAGAQPPTNLTEKFLIFKLYQGFWCQSRLSGLGERWVGGERWGGFGEDLCRRESRRYRFSPIGKLDQCKTLCGKIEKGRMATNEEYKRNWPSS